MSLSNAWWLYLIVSIVFVYVIMQSTIFLIKARKRALSLGFTNAEINKTMISSAIFSIAPSIAILIGLIALSKVFGPMLAGMRLATLGAVTYELPAAINVITGVFNKEIGDLLSQNIVVTAIWVMTLGCIPPLLIIPIFYQKMNKGIEKYKKRDQNWSALMMDALFLGMISAFVGYVFAPKTAQDNTTYISFLAILVFVFSAIFIMVFGVFIKKYKWEWLRNYALPLSMVLAMALAIVFSSMGVR
jgi:hypothetical protein